MRSSFLAIHLIVALTAPAIAAVITRQLSPAVPQPAPAASQPSSAVPQPSSAAPQPSPAAPPIAGATPGRIIHDRSAKTISITTAGNTLSIVIDYSAGACIKQLFIKGDNKLSQQGVYTGIQKNTTLFRSNGQTNKTTPNIIETPESITLKGIRYGNEAIGVTETWQFRLKKTTIDWDITREYDHDAVLEDMALPKFNFKDMSTWKAGIFDNGGMVWCKYLKEKDDTYGVHTGGVTFWNNDSGDGLSITTSPGSSHSTTSKASTGKSDKPSPGKATFIAAKYSRTNNNEFTCTQLVTENPLQQRYNLSRFVSKHQDVFAPFNISKGSTTIHLSLTYTNYFEKYSRGTLPGIDAAAVRELLNTTARYGVVDNNIIGGNGWTTNWKCLHEPFFAQIGMAVDDKNYTNNFSSTLDQERDEAMLPDGRVLSRWHDAHGDEIPGTYNDKTGYYEAMWGYTIDSQTGYIINLSEQFDITGDKKWLQTHKQSAEKALDWLIKRDANKNGIFEMANKNIAEQKCSDWLDIVYASFENAFVNAQLYEALTLWSACESALNDKQKAIQYTAIAKNLKTAFNKPIEQGGFWSESKKQYVYWRDNDGSIHGDNLVTPVNFAAIAYGICDDPKRTKDILDQIEQRTLSEHLFHWPLCFESFKREEVQQGNWPFPKYENGDIFPTWGCLGVRAYAQYDKNIALKYIHNILDQYNKDGLSSQRYSRTTQLGQGDDILAGICTSITALYRDIYGIRPKYNRIGLEPNMTEALNGTKFTYTLRDTIYQIKLDVNNYSISTKDFSIQSRQNFGVSGNANTLTYYKNNLTENTLKITLATAAKPVKTAKPKPVKLNLDSWSDQQIVYTIGSPGHYTCKITGLQPGTSHPVTINNQKRSLTASKEGNITFNSVAKAKAPTQFIIE